VRQHFHAFRPGKGNIGVLVGPGEAIMIDAGLAAADERILESIRKATPASTEILIDTHSHPAGALPLVMFSQSTQLCANGEDIEIVAVAPACADGDSFIHTGDLLFNGFYSLVDMPAGGMYGMVEAANHIPKIAGPKTIVIPGHGPMVTTTDLRSLR
jgi:glyoxylase-like metal-dependent hydrolase (beta-lactamase superfamily II)